MDSLFNIGVTADELAEQLADGTWTRWVQVEPTLACFSSVHDPAWRTSVHRDAGIGALLRLAARAGGDDDLAAIAVCHRVTPAMLRIAGEYRGVRSEVHAAVVGSLWEAVKQYSLDQRDRAHAARLVGDVRLRTRRYLTTSRHPHDRVQIIRIGDSELLDALGRPSVDQDDGTADLVDFLNWARRTGVLSDDDLRLLRDLIVAGYAAADEDTAWNVRGAASEAAREWLAARTASSPRTVRRRTDRVLHSLQAVAGRYLSEVA